MADERKDLPPVNSANFLEKVREFASTALGKRGDPLDRVVTLRDLVDVDLVKLRPGYGVGKPTPIAGVGPAVGTGSGGTVEPDLTPPPMPSGLIVTAGFANLLIEHASPVYTQGHGHARTRVYGATYTSALPVFSDARLITEFTGTVTAHPTSLGVKWRIWVSWVSNDGVEGPVAGGTNGADAQVGLVGGADLAPLIIDAGKLAAGAVDLGSTKVTGTITDPARFGAAAIGYTVTQYLVATSGVLGNLVVDNAQIASVSAAKLLAGALSVGQYIRSTSYVAGSSGWAINADGTAEFSAASIRGQLTASQINANGLIIRDNAGNPILGAGNALPLGYAPAGTLNSNISISASGVLSGAGGGQVTLPGIGLRTFRVGAYGLSATGMAIGSELRDGDTGALLVSGSSMYRVVKINRSTGAVTDVGAWNTLAGGSNPASMAAALNAIGNDHVVVVFSYDEPQGYRLSGGLDVAMYRCGASRSVFGSPNFKYRSAYILVGIPGCGEGNGIEQYRGDVDSDTGAWCDMSFAIRNGNIVAGGATATPRSLADFNAGAMAYINQITSANVSSYIASAAINLANINVASINTLAALSSVLGTVDIVTGGYLRSGQTDWSVGSGFWLGWIGSGPGEPGFSIGDGSAYLRYRPSTGLEIKLSTYTLSLSSSSGMAVYLYLGGNGTYTLGTYTATPAGGVAPYSYAWSISTYSNGVNPAQFTALIQPSGDTCVMRVNSTASSSASVAQWVSLTCTVTDANGRATSTTYSPIISWNGYDTSGL